MINRVLIRLKIVQIVYAYYQNGGKNLDTAEKELFFSLSKAYDLYNYLLLLMVEVTKQANKRLNAAKNKLVPTKEELFPNTKFVENRFYCTAGGKQTAAGVFEQSEENLGE